MVTDKVTHHWPRFRVLDCRMLSPKGNTDTSAASQAARSRRSTVVDDNRQGLPSGHSRAVYELTAVVTACIKLM